MIDMFYTSAEFVSLVLTVPTVILGVLVVWCYSPRALAAIRKPVDKMTETEMLIIGITIGFAGAVVDNIYWGLAWFHEMVGSSSAPLWFKNGVLSNVPFRQTAGIVAGAFHLYPIMVTKKEKWDLLKLVSKATASAVICLTILMVF